MEFEYDPKKNEINIKRRGLDFALAEFLDWENGVYTVDSRKDYDEVRLIGYVYLKGRLTVIVFTRRESSIRIISWRKANTRELRRYG